MADKIYSGTLIDILHEVERQGKDTFTEDELETFIGDIFGQARVNIDENELYSMEIETMRIH